MSVQTNPVPKPHIKQFFFCQIPIFLDYTQYILICQVLKHRKNPQKYPKTIHKSHKNVYNVWIIGENKLIFVMYITIGIIGIRDNLYTLRNVCLSCLMPRWGCRQKAAVYKSIPNIPIYTISYIPDIRYLTKICLFDILHESGKIFECS